VSRVPLKENGDRKRKMGKNALAKMKSQGMTSSIAIFRILPNCDNSIDPKLQKLSFMPMVRAFIFDFDGLIIDTEYPRYMGWKHIYSKFGCDMTPDDYSRCVGRGDGQFDFRADLEGKANAAVDWVEADRERLELRLSLLAQEHDLPGVRALIREAARSGIITAIASSSPRAWVHEQLQRISMLDYFTCIITVDDVVRAKPDPACYLKALAMDRHHKLPFCFPIHAAWRHDNF
jgi:putative hydrolase of the HAD superfamily